MISRTIEVRQPAPVELLKSMPEKDKPECERAFMNRLWSIALIRAGESYPQYEVRGLKLLRQWDSIVKDDFIPNLPVMNARFEVGLKLKPKGER